MKMLIERIEIAAKNIKEIAYHRKKQTTCILKYHKSCEIEKLTDETLFEAESLIDLKICCLSKSENALIDRKQKKVVDSEEDKDIESNLIYLSYVFDLIATISESNPYLLELYIKEINSIIEHPIIKSKIDYNSIANNLKSILMNT